jgi:hypothetical protein
MKTGRNGVSAEVGTVWDFAFQRHDGDDAVAEGFQSVLGHVLPFI